MPLGGLFRVKGLLISRDSGGRAVIMCLDEANGLDNDMVAGLVGGELMYNRVASYTILIGVDRR